MSRHADISNLRFNRWLVLSEDGRRSGHMMWRCRCDCGTERRVIGSHLMSGGSKSCGCHRSEMNRLPKPANRKHGLAGSPVYSVWGRMKTRCFNPKVASYPHYGGRGITVCKRWLTSFEEFNRDMGPSYRQGCSIDRIDNDGSYSCGICPDCAAHSWTLNCQWATPTQQTNNRRPRTQWQIKKPTGARGVRNSHAKLTEADVLGARRSYAAGGELVMDIARRYGLSDGAMGQVLAGKTWKHLLIVS